MWIVNTMVNIDWIRKFLFFSVSVFTIISIYVNVFLRIFLFGSALLVMHFMISFYSLCGFSQCNNATNTITKINKHFSYEERLQKVHKIVNILFKIRFSIHIDIYIYVLCILFIRGFSSWKKHNFLLIISLLRLLNTQFFVFLNTNWLCTCY